MARSTKQLLPVAVTQDKGAEILLLARFGSIGEAEHFLATHPSIDQGALVQGQYGIDAPEELVNPKPRKGAN